MTDRVVVVSNMTEPLGSARKEDTLLAEGLNKYISTTLVDLLELAEPVIDTQAVYLLRNVWGEGGVFDEDYTWLYEIFASKNIKYRNVFRGKADQKGKRYLTHLFEAEKAVIPSFESAASALKYEAETYLAKPLRGYDSKGIIELSREELTRFESDGYILQPKIKFESELSLFFIEDRYQYALKTKGKRWDLELYQPTDDELDTAKDFVTWNSIQGIQRIDFLRQSDGAILLCEIEDWAPYLSLFDVPDIPKEKFLKNLFQSLL